MRYLMGSFFDIKMVVLLHLTFAILSGGAEPLSSPPIHTRLLVLRCGVAASPCPKNSEKLVKVSI